MIISQKAILVLQIPFYYHLHHWIYWKWNLLFWTEIWIWFAKLVIFFFISEIVFFSDVYVNLPELFLKNSIFGEIPFSKVNFIF